MAGQALISSCGFDRQCAEVRRVGDDTLRVRGYLPDTEHVPENEREVDVPVTLFPGAAALEIPDFGSYLAKVRRARGGDILRIQTLRRYAVPSDQDFFRRYLDGLPGPSDEELAGWAAELDDDRANGRVYRNLHVVQGEIGDYLQMQFEWAYSFSTHHGMDVRIVDAAEVPAVAVLLQVGDFWVLEGEHVVRCRYDEAGHPQGHVAVDDSGKLGFLASAEMAWQLGTPFTVWWDAHPQYHRRGTRSV